MKAILTIFLFLFLVTGTGLAAEIDGTWISEREVVRGTRKELESQVFELKVQDKILTGTISSMTGEKTIRKVNIRDGKFEGKKFYFIAAYPTPFGEVKIAYEGTVEGKILKGTTGPPAASKRPFEAKRK